MSSQSTVESIPTLDGLRLAATLVTPGEHTDRAAVLVHGGGVTREEGGFFTRLSAGLADAGVASLRFDRCSSMGTSSSRPPSAMAARS